MVTPLVLVKPRPEHAAAWAKWRRQPEAQRYNPFEDHAIELLEQRLSILAGGFLPGIEDAGWIAEVDEKAVGLFALKINWRMQTATIGYHLDETLHGQGLGTEMVRSGLSLVWERSPLRKLTATIHAGNLPSKRVVEKLGFAHEGTRVGEWFLHGEVVDVDAYAIFRPSS